MEENLDKRVTVETLYGFLKERLSLTPLAGGLGKGRDVRSPRVLYPSVLLSGYGEQDTREGILLLSDPFLERFEKSRPEEKEKLLNRFYTSSIPCVIAVTGENVDPLLLLESECRGIPLFRSEAPFQSAVEGLTVFLSRRLTGGHRIHGVMMDIYGVGVLILGDSGVGKSENALDLVMRGHRLVSDDVVEIYETSGGDLAASSPELTRYHMEIRGLGIINIKDLFGISSIAEEKKVQLIISLERWDSAKEYERLGWEMKKKTLLEVEFPWIEIPVAPGRNLSAIIEVAVRVFLLRQMGINPVRDIDRRIREWSEENDDQ